MTYTETQSEKRNKQKNERYTHKNKPTHNVTVNCNKAVTEGAETTSSINKTNDKRKC